MGGGGQDLALKVLLQASDQTGGTMRGFGSNLASFLENPAKAVGLGMIGLGVAVAAVGAKATMMAGDFQQAMLSNVAHAGLAKSQFDSVSQSILHMSTEVGRSPTELAEAMYPILSAFSGITNQSAKSSLALDTLKMSFQAVAGTTVNGTDVANAAVGTFNALGMSTNNAATNAARMKNLFDVMDLTVQQGNMQWSAYKNVISKLAVSIQGTGVKFNEASAALATLTNEGYSAQKAQTYLSNMFVSMAIKTDALAKHAKTLKIAFNEQKYSAMDLTGKIGYLNEVTGGNQQKILALLGGNATALKSFNALSTGVDSYKTNLKALNNAHGALKASFDTASQGFKFSMSQLKATLDAVMISLGTKLLPVVTQFAKEMAPIVAKVGDWLVKSGALDKVASALGTTLGVIVNVIGTLLTKGAQFARFMSTNSAGAIALKIAFGLLLGGILGFVAAGIPALVMGFIAWTMAAGAAAIATIAATWPFILAGVVVAAVVIGIIVAVKNWGAISKWLQGVWEAFSKWFMSALGAVGKFFTDLWNTVKNATVNAWNALVNSIKTGTSNALTTVGNFIGGVGNWFASLPGKALQWGQNMVNGFIQGIKNMVGAAGNAAHDVIKNVENFMGFKSPSKQGVGSQAHTWAPNLMKMFTSGLNSGVSPVAKAVDLISQQFLKLNPKSGITGGDYTNMIKEAKALASQLGNGNSGGVMSLLHSSKDRQALDVAHGNKRDAAYQGVQMQLIGNLLKSFGFTSNGMKILPKQDKHHASGKYSVMVGSGNTTATAGAGGMSSASGGVTVNNVIYISALKATAKEVAKEVVDIISNTYRRSGNLVTITSGGRA